MAVAGVQVGADVADLRGRDGAEALLAGRVPDLQLHLLPVDLHCADLEVHPNRGDVAACTCTHISRAQHSARARARGPSTRGRAMGSPTLPHCLGSQDTALDEEDAGLELEWTEPPWSKGNTWDTAKHFRD